MWLNSPTRHAGMFCYRQSEERNADVRPCACLGECVRERSREDGGERIPALRSLEEIEVAGPNQATTYSKQVSLVRGTRSQQHANREPFPASKVQTRTICQPILPDGGLSLKESLVLR